MLEMRLARANVRLVIAGLLLLLCSYSRVWAWARGNVNERVQERSVTRDLKTLHGSALPKTERGQQA